MVNQLIPVFTGERREIMRRLGVAVQKDDGHGTGGYCEIRISTNECSPLVIGDQIEVPRMAESLWSIRTALYQIL